MPEKPAPPEARTFYADTRFERLARRPGGVPRTEAIKKAQASIEELKPSFGTWLDQELAELRKVIKSNASRRSRDQVWIETAVVYARRIRDLGATMEFELVSFIANNLCDIFEAVSAGAKYRNDVVDCHLEALQLVGQEQFRGVRPDQLPELSGGLRNVLERAITSAQGVLK